MVAPSAVVSTSDETVLVVLAVVFAGLCFARAATFLLGPIGAFLTLLACATTRVSQAFGPSGPGAFGPIPPPEPPPGGPPPGWYPDPSGRHEYRFFTGDDWTADVVDNGNHFIDPLPAPPDNPG
jgi:hypothetical protein